MSFWIIWKKIVPFVRFLYSSLKLTWEPGTNNYFFLFFSSLLGLESTSSSFLLRLMKSNLQAGLLCNEISHIFCMCHLGKVPFKEWIWIILLIFSSYHRETIVLEGKAVKVGIVQKRRLQWDFRLTFQEEEFVRRTGTNFLVRPAMIGMEIWF